MLNFGTLKLQQKPARALHEYTWKEWRNGTLALLIMLPFLAACTWPVASLMVGTWVLLWDLVGHLPLFSFSPEQWLYGPEGPSVFWFAPCVLAVWLGSFCMGCKWLLWAGFQYGFRTSATTGIPFPSKARAFKPLPRRACPPETLGRHQEIRCLITLITGFLAYAWFVVACVVGFHLCSAARAMDTPVASLSLSRLLWWRQAFPEHWSPNILPEVLCLYVLSLTLAWSGYSAGRTAAGKTSPAAPPVNAV